MIEQIFDEDFNSLPGKAKKELLYQGRIKVELLVIYLYFFCLKPYEHNAEFSEKFSDRSKIVKTQLLCYDSKFRVEVVKFLRQIFRIFYIFTRRL